MRVMSFNLKRYVSRDRLGVFNAWWGRLVCHCVCARAETSSPQQKRKDINMRIGVYANAPLSLNSSLGSSGCLKRRLRIGIPESTPGPRNQCIQLLVQKLSLRRRTVPHTFFEFGSEIKWATVLSPTHVQLVEMRAANPRAAWGFVKRLWKTLSYKLLCVAYPPGSNSVMDVASPWGAGRLGSSRKI